MKKIIKITSYGNYPQCVHAAYSKNGKVIRYFLLRWFHNAAPIDPKDVKRVMAIAKAEALARGMTDVHARAIDYRPKDMARIREIKKGRESDESVSLHVRADC